jgi:hypothetical protein
LISASDGKGGVLALLPREQTFIFDLRDANGNVVKKTNLGIQNSKPLDVGKIINDLKISRPNWTDQQRADFLPYELKIGHNPISPSHCLLNNLFVPDNYFVITNKGIYTLDVQMRAWTKKQMANMA